MTPLHRPVRRVLDVCFRHRPLVVEMTREGLYFRRKGERKTGPTCYLLPCPAPGVPPPPARFP